MSEAAKALVFVLLALYVVSWIVALAGLAAVQGLEVVASWELSLYWFILFVQLLLIIAIPLLSVMGLLKRLRVSIIGMLVMVSTIWLVAANEAYKNVRARQFNETQFNAAVAGACMLFITNVFAMFLIDFDTSDASSSAAVGATPPKVGHGGQVGGVMPPVTVVQVPDSKGSPAVSV